MASVVAGLTTDKAASTTVAWIAASLGPQQRVFCVDVDVAVERRVSASVGLSEKVAFPSRIIPVGPRLNDHVSGPVIGVVGLGKNSREEPGTNGGEDPCRPFTNGGERRRECHPGTVEEGNAASLPVCGAVNDDQNVGLKEGKGQHRGSK
jgi:hypothetical protein